MKLPAQLKSDIIKVVWITIVFVLINWFLTLYNHAIITTGYSLGPSEIYQLDMSYLLNTLTGLLAGIFGGSVLVMVHVKIFRKRSYAYALKATFIAYSLVFVIITLTMSFLSARMALGEDAGFNELYAGAARFMFSPLALVFYILWGSVSLLLIFFLQISDKFGPGMFWKFLIGKYHRPLEEQRIFMFLDMKSSTTIAEQIGNKEYFNLLNDLFSDITGAILSCEGEIYQYVGDEVVISWNLESGVRKANCLECFNRIREKLNELTPYYLEKYGVAPEFKAGLHHGLVTAGEIGSIKKDIAYSGDVLNTTARIQEQCNNYNVNFLVSLETLKLLGENIPFETSHLANIELRGKKKQDRFKHCQNELSFVERNNIIEGFGIRTIIEN